MEESQERKSSLTPRQAKLKIESYCAYQERAQQEVRDKLYSWGLHHDDVEELIADLISENFLNEERFAKAYTLGKFRMQSWGKVKIKQGLKFKRISDKLIQIALREIDLDDYENRVKELIQKKISGDPSALSIAEKAKLVRYLQSKGYESDLIFIQLNKC